MAGAGRGERGLRARTATAVVLAILAALLAPVGVVAGWAWVQVSDTDRFVATYAPLARDPQVQQLVVTRVSGAVASRLGVLGQNAIVAGAVTDSVTSLVDSPAFATVWAQTLRTAHQQLRALLADEQGVLEIEDNTLQMPLGPFFDALKQRLVAAGVPLADRLPSVTAAVALVELDPRVVALARGSYRGLEAAASWLPWLALLCGAAAVLVWPNKRRAFLGQGVLVSLGAITLFAGWAAAEPILIASFAAAAQPVVTSFLTIATATLASPVLGLAVTGAVLLFVGALTQRMARAT
jgi:hypothetical protein